VRSAKGRSAFHIKRTLASEYRVIFLNQREFPPVGSGEGGGGSVESEGARKRHRADMCRID